MDSGIYVGGGIAAAGGGGIALGLGKLRAANAVIDGLGTPDALAAYTERQQQHLAVMGDLSRQLKRETKDVPGSVGHVIFNPIKSARQVDRIVGVIRGAAGQSALEHAALATDDARAFGDVVLSDLTRLPAMRSASTRGGILVGAGAGMAAVGASVLISSLLDD